MIWFGWCDAEAQWPRASATCCREVLQRLLPEAWNSLTDPRGLWLVSPQTSQGSVGGDRASLLWSMHEGGLPISAVDWHDSAPPVAELLDPLSTAPPSCLRVDVVTSFGRQIGGLMLLANGVYDRKEVHRGLEASLDALAPRPGRHAVLASARRPLPRLRPSRPDDLSPTTVLCRCERLTCPSRGRPMLLRLGGVLGHGLPVPPDAQGRPPAPDAAGRMGRGLRHHPLNVVAYPCPSCPGSWEQRWPLAFVARATPADLAGSGTVEYSVPPTQRRRTSVAGPLLSVVTSGPALARATWAAEGVPQILSRQVRKFLRDRRPLQLAQAIRGEPDSVGPLLPGLLTAANLRAFVELVRKSPANRRGDLAVALAHAFCPRAVREYRTPGADPAAARFPYIAYDVRQFYRRLRDYRCLRRHGAFLDVGCGIGEKVFLAYAVGSFIRCDGIEYEPRTAAVAEFLFNQIGDGNPYPCRIMQADALGFDRYGDYEVIYMFRPFRDRSLMHLLLKTITAQMRPGSLVCDVYREGMAIRKRSSGGLMAAAPARSPTSGTEKPHRQSIPSLEAFLDQGGLP